MIFIFDEAAGADRLLIKGEVHKYLVKVRRHQEGDAILFRHPDASETLYTYRIDAIDGRQASLSLLQSDVNEVYHSHALHIGWCAIDPKSVEKVLPQLNELGVAKITFISCERSQKQFKPDLKRYERLLHASMQQCGRSRMMQFEMVPDVSTFLQAYPDAVAFDFSEQVFDAASMRPSTVLIGPEGGFCEAERSQFDVMQRFRLATPTVLRSETAAVAMSSAILL